MDFDFDTALNIMARGLAVGSRHRYSLCSWPARWCGCRSPLPVANRSGFAGSPRATRGGGRIDDVRTGSRVSFRPRPDVALAWRGCRTNPGTGYLADPFAINPIRRSATLVVGCAAIVFLPWCFGDELATTVMLSVGWLAMTGLVIGMPVLLLSLGEEGFRAVRRRLRPTVDQLEITPRVAHILLRHGYEAIDEVDRA